MASPLWQIVLRSAAVYAALFVALRLAGKRELGQMTVFDLTVILLIANAVQNAMVGPDTSLQGGIVAAVVLLAANRGTAALPLRGERWGRLIEGTPTVLIQDGRMIEANLRRERVDTEEIEMALREHGVESAASVKLAVLEVDGSISIVPATTQILRTRRRLRQHRRR